MDAFHGREATAKDREEVLRIHDNVYYGLDYIESYYDYFVSSLHTTPFVLLHNDTIIAFMAAQVIDNGKTLATRAARINPSYEGRGLYRFLDDFVGKWAASNNVSMKTFVTTDQNSNISKPSFKSAYTLLQTKNILIYSVEPVESRNRINEVQRNADLENISDTALETLITSEETKQYLFPSERVVVDTVPYQPIKTNVPILRGPNGSTIVFSDVRNASGAYTGLLSFGTLYRVKQPSFQYTVELYGKDETSLGNHIMSHLKNLIEQVDGETYMVFYLEKHIQIENVDKALEGCGIKRTFVRDPVTSKILFTEQFLYEKSVK